MDGQSFLFMIYFCALGAENSQKLVYISELNQHKRGSETTSCSAPPFNFCVSVLYNKTHKVLEIEMQCVFSKNCYFLKFLTVGVHKSWATEFCAEVPNVFNIITEVLSLTKTCMISLLQAEVSCNSEVHSTKLASCHSSGTL